MKKSSILIPLTIITCLLSCSLEEGKGGKAEISGQVIFQVKYSNPILGIKDSVINEYPAVDEKVFLSYGENSIYDDDFSTDENGRFKFTGLTKGKYNLTVYSYCKTCDSGIEAKYQEINLETHKSKVVASTIPIDPKK